MMPDEAPQADLQRSIVITVIAAVVGVLILAAV